MIAAGADPVRSGEQSSMAEHAKPRGIDAAVLKHAADVIHDGGIVAYPTEAVYGLGCDPRDEHAVRRLLALKQRPEDKGLILIAADIAQLTPWLGPLDADSRRRCEASWPGAATWVVPARADTSALLTGGRDTLAVRVTAHPVAAALCRTCGHALVSTSANRSGAPPLRNAQAVEEAFGADVELVLAGEVGGAARPTPIRDARTGAVLRE